MVLHRKTPADIKDPDLPARAFLSFLDDICSQVQGLDIILKIGTLAPHMKTQTFDDEAKGKGTGDQIDRLARICPELG